MTLPHRWVRGHNKDCPEAGKEVLMKHQTHKQLRRSSQIFFFPPDGYFSILKNDN